MFPLHHSKARVSGLSMVLLISLGLVVGPREVSAQVNQQTVHIRIFHAADNAKSCYYQLLDNQMTPLADQDNFQVKPSALVHFMAENVNAQVIAEPDTVKAHANYGLMPFAGPPTASTFFLSSGGTKGLRVRSRTGSLSEHKVNISCFVEPPVPSQTSSGPSDLTVEHANFRTIPAIPASASDGRERRESDITLPDPPEHPLATGGPGMQVDDP